MPLKKHAYLNAIVNAAQESIASPESKLSTTCKQEILLADDDATLMSPAPGMSPNHQEMKDTSSHAAALICPNLKDGIEASDAQCLELLKNAIIEKDEDVSYILFNSIFDLICLFCFYFYHTNSFLPILLPMLLPPMLLPLMLRVMSTTKIFPRDAAGDSSKATNNKETDLNNNHHEKSRPTPPKSISS